MDKLAWSILDNSTAVMENVSDVAMINSTTSSSLASRLISRQIMATIGLIICSIGAFANAGVLAVLVKARRQSASAVHILIANQSAMDLFACVFAMVNLLIGVTKAYKYGGNEIMDGTICVLFDAGIKTASAVTEELRLDHN